MRKYLAVAGWARPRRALSPWAGACDPDLGTGLVEKLDAPKIHDRRNVGATEKIRFTSSILPKWMRRRKSLNALLPILYLRGISADAFQ
jgi:hypothetical protein